VLLNADEPLGPKEVAEMTDARYGATRELLSQMAKAGQVKNLGRGQYVHPDNLRNIPDNADILTNGRGDVSLSGMSGHFRKEGGSGIKVNEQGEAEF
jgi:hypothetical protein